MRIRSIVLVSLLSIPALAQAQYHYRRPPPRHDSYDVYRGPGPHGPVFGLRLGFGVPSGRLSNEGDPHLSDFTDHQVPIWIEMGYRFNPYVWGSVHGQISPTQVSNAACGGGNDCSAMNYRIGADLQAHLMPYGPFDPWFGIGFGYEWLKAEAFDTNGVFTDFSFSGWQLPLLETGMDFTLSPNFALGPYLAWAPGWYNHVDATQGGVTTSDHINSQAYHGWFQFGIKGTFKL